jgi:TFIIF-interacting CTD phosphatase-like protein
MAQDQKRNPHRREEGTKLRTVVGESETPKDLKTLHLEETEEHSYIRGSPQDEPEAGGPKGVISDPAD